MDNVRDCHISGSTIPASCQSRNPETERGCYPRTMDSFRGHVERFGLFLKLGLTSFGGPAAHLGLFRREFVQRLGWLDEGEYAELIALCQALPGPSSSQVALLVGHRRGGSFGAFLAWLGFTLPGALLLATAALLLPVDGGGSWIHGLKVFAVAVVAHACWGMGRALTPDLPRGAIALGAAGLCALVDGGAGQMVAIAAGGCAGLLLTGGSGPAAPRPASRRREALLLLPFAALLAVALVPWPRDQLAGLVAGMVRSGSLVFGGGHVVLPLLREEVVAGSGLTESVFLAGYGLAQGMPGPLFNVAAWIGAARAGVLGAALATVAIFLPGALVALGARPLWDRLRELGPFQRVLRGVNAAVVGLLALALVRHVAPAGLHAVADFLVAGICLALLFRTRLPPWLLATGCAAWAWLAT